MIFAEHLRNAITASGLTNANLAATLGVAVQTLHQWQRPGCALPAADHVLELAQYLDLDVRDFCHRYTEALAARRAVKTRGAPAWRAGDVGKTQTVLMVRS